MAKPPSNTDTDPARPVWRKLAWFAGLWVASGGVTAVVSYALRALLLP